MKNILVILLMFNWAKHFSQSFFIELPEQQLLGYVFEETYQPNFKINQIEGRFTPGIEEINNAEALLNNFDVKNRQSKRSQRRQYLGFERMGTKYILVHTLYYKCEKQFQEDYPDWDKSYAYLFSEPDKMQKSILYLVNLKDRTIGYYY